MACLARDTCSGFERFGPSGRRTARPAGQNAILGTCLAGALCRGGGNLMLCFGRGIICFFGGLPVVAETYYLIWLWLRVPLVTLGPTRWPRPTAAYCDVYILHTRLPRKTEHSPRGEANPPLLSTPAPSARAGPFPRWAKRNSIVTAVAVIASGAMRLPRPRQGHRNTQFPAAPPPVKNRRTRVSRQTTFRQKNPKASPPVLSAHASARTEAERDPRRRSRRGPRWPRMQSKYLAARGANREVADATFKPSQVVRGAADAAYKEKKQSFIKTENTSKRNEWITKQPS